MKHFLILLLFIFNACAESKNDGQKSKTESESVNQVEKITRQDSLISSSENFVEKAPDVKVDTEAIIGEWQRTDADYVINIKNVLKDHTLDAEYFNPKSINIDKTEWKIEEGNIYFFIKFDDVGYPGSYYSLAYFPDEDKLFGFYFQATAKQRYDIAFERK